jgi:glycogen synthase
LRRQSVVRVLFWSELYPPYRGGIEQLAARLAQAMQARGHEYVVVTSHDTLDLPDEESIEGVRVRRFPFRAVLRSGDVDAFVGLRRELARLGRAFAPQLVHLFTIGPSTIFYLSHAEWRSVPTLATLHGEILRGTVGGADSVLEKTLRAADWTTGVSGAVLRAARERVPEVAGRSSVLYTGLEAPPRPPGRPAREQPRLLCLGRLVRDKGFDLALQAFASVTDRFPEARLVIAGDGVLRDELRALAVQLRIDERVDFLGWVASDQVPALLDAASLVLMPSRREGLPLVAIQAAQMARPVVATSVGGLPEIVAYGLTGLIVPAEHSAALAYAVSYLLGHPAEAERMGRMAARRALNLFGWERYLVAWEDLYREVVAKATGAPAS